MSLSNEAIAAWEKIREEIPPKPRRDAFAIMMKGLTGLDDTGAGNPITDPLWLRADEADERDRVRRFFEDCTAGDVSDPCGSGFGASLTFEGRTWGQLELKDEMQRRAHGLLRQGYDTRSVAARTHLTVEEAERIKTFFRL